MSASTVWRGFSLRDPERHRFRAIETQRLPARALFEHEGNDAHADQVRAVDALIALAMTAFTPNRFVPLAAQSREEPLPYSTPANTTSGTFSAAYFTAGVVDRELLARGMVDGVAAFDDDVAGGILHHVVP